MQSTLAKVERYGANIELLGARLYAFYAMRALIITRLSKQVEESTSAERQCLDHVFSNGVVSIG